MHGHPAGWLHNSQHESQSGEGAILNISLSSTFRGLHLQLRPRCHPMTESKGESPAEPSQLMKIVMRKDKFFKPLRFEMAVTQQEINEQPLPIHHSN